MVYRHTEDPRGKRDPQKVMDLKAARAEAILATAADLISKRGADALTCAEIARRTKLSQGTIVNYFETMEALTSAVCMYVVNQDLDALAEVAVHDSATENLATVLGVLVKRMRERPRLAVAMFHKPMYRAAIAAELERRIRKAAPYLPRPLDAPLVAAAVLGAIQGVGLSDIKNGEKQLVMVALRAIGVESTHAHRLVFAA